MDTTNLVRSGLNWTHTQTANGITVIVQLSSQAQAKRGHSPTICAGYWTLEIEADQFAKLYQKYWQTYVTIKCVQAPELRAEWGGVLQFLKWKNLLVDEQEYTQEATSTPEPKAKRTRRRANDLQQ